MYAAPEVPLWSGQTYDQLSSIAEMPKCRSSEFITVKVTVLHYGEHAYFFLKTPVPKIRDGQWDYVHNKPTAEYQVPNSYILSDIPGGKYRIYGGTIMARCAWRLLRTPFGFEVHMGQVTTYGYNGILELAPSNGTGPGRGRGWGARFGSTDSGSGNGWGSGGSWQEALAKYLDTQQCTVGWEIWIDGAQRCRADGTRV